MRIWDDIIKGQAVGGRATDLEQISLTILCELNALYPKGAPAHIQNRLIILAKKLQIAELEMKEFAQMMLRELSNDT